MPILIHRFTMQNLIRSFLSIALFLLLSLNTNAQILFTYGNSSTSVNEFLRAYNKNNTGNENKEKAIKEYLDLYSNFKLKVKAAQELKLDTLEQIKFEVKNFRDQIIDNYLVDTKSMQAIVNEAAQRSKVDVNVAFYFIPNTDSTTSILKAKELLVYLKAKEKLTGEAIAQKFSTDKIKIKFTYAGFVTAFSTKYDFENAIYNTPIGGVSEVVKTSKGYYIFLPLEARLAIGKWTVAQILFLYPPSADDITKNQIKHKADSIYTLINKGFSFEEAAKKYSEDKATAQGGGVMQEFGSGKYVSSFEENVIVLKNDRDISKPFETEFGIHILKRISNTAAPTNTSDYAYQAELKQKILQDARIEKERLAFAKNTTMVTGFKKNTGIIEKDLYLPIDSLSKNNTAIFDKISILKKQLASFKDGSKVNGTDWINYLKTFYSNVEHPILSNKQLLEDFYNQKIIEKYKANLENYNEEFKMQMQEFKEGNMLFEVMERNVWGKASIDSTAIINYYNANKQKYMWAESADIVTFNCTTELVAKNALQELLAGNTISTTIQKSNNAIQTDSSRLELTQINGIDINKKPTKDSYSKITINTDGTASFVHFLKLYPANVVRSFAEARGLVINDYQTLLEKFWVDSLKKKYPIKINDTVLSALIK